MSDDEDSRSSYDEEAEFKKHVSSQVIIFMQNARYDVFKNQDQEKGHFDCAIEIGGKKLYCHKFVLATASETFNAMLSDRWNKSNENVIKIDNLAYNYECFYDFLTFLYSGFCIVTQENFQLLTDMAEYYGLGLLKQLCDMIVSKITLTLENVEEMTEFIDKYSLENSLEKLKQYVKENFNDIIKVPQFYEYKKSFIEILSTLIEQDKQPIYFNIAYKWAKHQALAKKAELKNYENFDVDEYVRDQLDEVVLDNINFYEMEYKFIRKSVVEKRVLFSPCFLYDIVANCKRFSSDEDDCFYILYCLAEEVVKKKQKAITDGGSFDIDEAIRTELADVLPDQGWAEIQYT